MFMTTVFDGTANRCEIGLCFTCDLGGETDCNSVNLRGNGVGVYLNGEPSSF